jgi:hypothetical protein
MSEAIAVTSPGRRWLFLAWAGCGLVLLAMAVSGLVMFDKDDFGWMVGTWFLPIITGGVFLGAILLLVAAWKLPGRKSWRGILLIVWALIALTSPAFGYLFLAPWAVLILLLPFVIAAFVTLPR